MISQEFVAMTFAVKGLDDTMRQRLAGSEYGKSDRMSSYRTGKNPSSADRDSMPASTTSVKQGHARKFFLLDEFDLTPAEQYLADEFASVDCI